MPRTLEEAQVIVDRILAPLVAHDSDHASELLRTLQVLLATDGSWRHAALDLQVHKQTLGTG